MATTRTRRGLLWAERVLFVGGVACLLWVFVARQQAASFQRTAVREFMSALSTVELPELPGDHGRSAAGTVTADAPFGDTSLIGVLDIPRLNVSVAVLEGDDDGALGMAAGHLPDTPLPWNTGNAAVAAHRDTYFRPLERLEVGDELALSTRHGVLRYRVSRLTIVGPKDVWVLNPGGDVSLTLITCYPFNFIGAAPQRFIVHAARIAEKT